MSSGPRIRLIEMLMLLICLGLAAGHLAGMLTLHREQSRRRGCHTHLRHILNGLYFYAHDESVYPMSTNPDGEGRLSFFQHRFRPPASNDTPSPTVDLWMLVRKFHDSPRIYVCPSSNDVPDPIDDPTNLYDFSDQRHLSYSYLSQYHRGRGPLRIDTELMTPLAADSNPYVKGGLEMEAGGFANINRGNSRNHRSRAGQSVGFVDTHVEFRRSARWEFPGGQYYPKAGPDNIYTTHMDGEPADPGNAPTWTRSQIGSKSDYCLVP